LSQKSATEKALTEQISVIEGPPGTGKTQTILIIIANAVINGKKVAVVSKSITVAIRTGY
jgi:KaiC/GvpD/RAD55 family RecA-like ATPase